MLLRSSFIVFVFLASAAWAADAVVIFPNVSARSYLGLSLKSDVANRSSYGTMRVDGTVIPLGTSFDVISTEDSNFAIGANAFIGWDIGFFERHHLALTLFSDTFTFKTTSFSTILRTSIVYQFYIIPSFNIGIGTGFGSIALRNVQSFNHGQDTIYFNTQAYTASLLLSTEYILAKNHGFSILFNMANAIPSTASITQYAVLQSSGIINGESGYTYYPRSGVDFTLKPIYSFSLLYRYLF